MVQIHAIHDRLGIHVPLNSWRRFLPTLAVGRYSFKIGTRQACVFWAADQANESEIEHTVFDLFSRSLLATWELLPLQPPDESYPSYWEYYRDDIEQLIEVDLAREDRRPFPRIAV